MVGYSAGWLDGWMDGWMDGWDCETFTGGEGDWRLGLGRGVVGVWMVIVRLFVRGIFTGINRE